MCVGVLFLEVDSFVLYSYALSLSLSHSMALLSNTHIFDCLVIHYSVHKHPSHAAGDLKAFFSDVVKPKSLSSPRARPRSQSEKTSSSGKTISPLADNHQRVMGTSPLISDLSL